MAKPGLFKVLTAVIGMAMPLIAQAADKLPALHADSHRTSVSGLSSGAFMAVQYDVAFSGSLIGAGIVAGGPYDCGLLYGALSIATCTQGLPSGALSYSNAVGLAAAGMIDPLVNLAKGRFYLFSGTADPVVKQSVMDAVRDFYVLANLPQANLLYVNNVPAGHAFLSAISGNTCGATAAPFVNQCTVGNAPYDQPQAVLQQIYGNLRPKASQLSAAPRAFDQAEFAGPLTGMAATGYVYIPSTCQAQGSSACAVHVVFHGCEQGAGEVHDAVYAKLGYNEWADANNIIVLYPQIDPTIVPVNPEGCWDWFGYTGFDFQSRTGKQMNAIHAMVNRLTEGAVSVRRGR